MIDNAHALVNHSEFDPFGKILKTVNASRAEVNSNNLAIDAAFAGREWDDEAGLYYNRARWYDAAEGRFISEDPLGLAAGDASVYRYAAGDPVNGRDPSGQFLSKIIRETRRVVDQVEEAVEDAGDYVEEKYKGTVAGLEYAIRNPEDAIKALATDPWFWAGLAVGSITFSWGFFNVNYGLGGLNNGINFLDLGRQALNLASGNGLNLGLPTISVNSPLASLAKGAINGVLRQGSSGYGVIQAGHNEEVTFRGQNPDSWDGTQEPWYVGPLESAKRYPGAVVETAGGYGYGVLEAGAGAAQGAVNLVYNAPGTIGWAWNNPWQATKNTAWAPFQLLIDGKEAVSSKFGAFLDNPTAVLDKTPFEGGRSIGAEVPGALLTLEGGLRAPRLVRPGDLPTKTVWSRITPTQEVWPGTVIPRSFTLNTQSGTKLWVHANATEHMVERVANMAGRPLAPGLERIGQQAMLTSLEAAVNATTRDGIPFGKMVVKGGWELMFAPPRKPGDLPVLKHALPLE